MRKDFKSFITTVIVSVLLLMNCGVAECAAQALEALPLLHYLDFGVSSIVRAQRHYLGGIIKDDGTPLLWGDYSMDSSLSFIQLENPDSSTYVGVTSDSRVYVDAEDMRGMLGDGTNMTGKSYVPGLSNIKEISAQSSYVLALSNNGKVYGWGDNAYGILGKDSNQYEKLYAPELINGLPVIKHITTANYMAMAIDVDGNVWTWGDNSAERSYNQSAHTPVKVTGLSNIISVSISRHCLYAVDSGGYGYAWGQTYFGSLCDNAALVTSSTIIVATPQRMVGIENAVKIEAGTYYGYVLTRDGSVWAWGFNTSGQLADGTTVSRSRPLKIQNLPPIKGVTALGNSITGKESTGAYVISETGIVYSVGVNDSNSSQPLSNLYTIYSGSTIAFTNSSSADVSHIPADGCLNVNLNLSKIPGKPLDCYFKITDHTGRITRVQRDTISKKDSILKLSDLNLSDTVTVYVFTEGLNPVFDFVKFPSATTRINE